jgi:hypothetical protein
MKVLSTAATPILPVQWRFQWSKGDEKALSYRLGWKTDHTAGSARCIGYASIKAVNLVY